MLPFRIPKRLRVFGQTVTIERNADLSNAADAMFGRVVYDKLLIQISKGLTREQAEHTFLHELNHMILFLLNRRKLCDNERFVDTHAGCLHQALSTMEYGDKQ